MTVFVPLLPDKPGCPVNFHVTDVTDDTVSLAWSTPEDDGGCDIKDYVIEKRESSKRSWQPVARTTELQLSASNLQEGTTYLFRIAATNDVGSSDWVELDKSVTPKSQYSQYHFVVILEGLRYILGITLAVVTMFN